MCYFIIFSAEGLHLHVSKQSKQVTSARGRRRGGAGESPIILQLRLRRRRSYRALNCLSNKGEQTPRDKDTHCAGCPCVVQGPPMVLSCVGAHGHAQQAHPQNRGGGKTQRERERKKKNNSDPVPRVLSSRRVTRSQLSWLSKEVFSPLCKSTEGDGAASADGGRGRTEVKWSQKH